MMFNIQKKFSYGYLPGSNLLHTLTMPCNMTLTQSYETQRDLLIGMAYHRGSTLVAQRTYTYDTLGRPLTRSTARNGQTVNGSFVHNSRSELTGATVNGSTYGYGWDLTKNICEVFGPAGYIRTAYSYSPYGSVTASGDVTQPIQWSSEYNDEELALVYYNYRHYNPVDGRWMGRDRIGQIDNLYEFTSNNVLSQYDCLGDVARVVSKLIETVLTKFLIDASVEYIYQGVTNCILETESPWNDDINWSTVTITGITGVILPAPSSVSTSKKIVFIFKQSKQLSSRISKCQKVSTNKPLSSHMKKVQKRYNKKVEMRQHYSNEMQDIISEYTTKKSAQEIMENEFETIFNEIMESIQSSSQPNKINAAGTIDAEITIQ